MQHVANLPDHELIRLFMEGDREAISGLVYRYKNQVFTSIYLLVKDKDLAEDIFHDCFVKVIDTLNSGRYTHQGKFLAWVMRIAHNLSVDHFRKQKSNPVIKNFHYKECIQTDHLSYAVADEALLRKQRHDTVSKMLDLLTEDQREVVILKHYAGLTFKEIAAITNCSINTSLGRMHYALINLRKMLKEKQLEFN